MTSVEMMTPSALAEAERWTAHNYHPLPVVVAEADGAWVTDVDGRRYLDALAGYSALNFGHRHPGLLQAARDQLDSRDRKMDLRADHLAQIGRSAADAEIDQLGQRIQLQFVQQQRRSGRHRLADPI